jgi:GNAT superfamily N-acetyltransferase
MATENIREATLDDAPQMAEVFAKGFINDDVFGRFMHPHRREYPDDWLQHWTRDMRHHIIDPSGRCFVRTDEAGAVRGCVLMRRLGSGGQVLVAKETLVHATERKICEAQDRASGLVWEDKSADKEAMAAFDENWDDIKHHFTGSRTECWLIELLCIHPDVQKGGYGRAMINKAIEVCKGERSPTPLAVITSEIGDAFYEKMGFQEIGRANVGGLASVRGGPIRIYECHLK